MFHTSSSSSNLIIYGGNSIKARENQRNFYSYDEDPLMRDKPGVKKRSKLRDKNANSAIYVTDKLLDKISRYVALNFDMKKFLLCEHNPDRRVLGD